MLRRPSNDSASPRLPVGMVSEPEETGIVFREPWKGPIAEMLVYGRSLTPEERIAVEDYLAGKYELTLTR